MILGLSYVTFKNILIGFFMLLLALDITYFGTNIEYIDMIFEVIIIFLIVMTIFLKKENLEKSKYNEIYINNYKNRYEYEDIIELNKINWKTYFIIISIIVLGEFYNDSKLGLGDFIYSYFLIVTSLSLLTKLDSLDYYKGYNKIKSKIEKTEEVLNTYNETSIFRIRVSEALNLIKEINRLNLINQKINPEMKTLIDAKQSKIEEKLDEVLKDIVLYNNDKNEIILNRVQKNIELLNKIKTMGEF